MQQNHHFISYSFADPKAEAFALHLADALQAGPPSIPVWLYKRESHAGIDWDTQIVEAIRSCATLLFIMTRDSVMDQSGCKQEWMRALKYKKPVIPLRLHAEAELPYRLEPRERIDFTGDFKTSLARLREHLQWRTSPAGVLHSLQERLADAQYAMGRPHDPAQTARIQDDLAQLQKQISEQQRIVDDPRGAAERVAASIAAGLEREREPQKPSSVEARAKFINPPPMTAPSYFQDRTIETKLIADFLRDDSRRMLTLVGRGGTGKTALACRLLKALEHGHLPDDLGPLAVEGIVYLSAVGSRRVNVPDLFSDVLKLLPPVTAQQVDSVYKNPQASTDAKMRALLAAFPAGRFVVLLDNFEDVVNAETLRLRDAELEDALTALLHAPAHGLKVIITTRIAPRSLALVQPGRQTRLDLDEGLDSPFAENILRELDVDAKVGLKTAPEHLLAQARTRTRGFPRALEALFAILSADRDTTLREILQNVGAHDRAPLPENVVRDLVGEAFDRLDPIAAHVMQALAIYARPVTPTAVDYVLQPFLTGVDSAPVLSRLVNMHFVRKEAGRYYLHPVDREYALSRVPRGEASDREVLDGKTPFTHIALADRGANYFAEARLPREHWKTLADLAAQLAEIDLRCAAEDFDAAAEVLTNIDDDYLGLWGHYRLMITLYENLQGKLNDPDMKRRSVGNLGWVYYCIGQVQRAISCYKQAHKSAQEMKNRQAEGTWLGNLGGCYSALGETRRAIEYHEQALAIAREIGNRSGEGSALGNLGNRYSTLGETRRAMEYLEQSLAIMREIGNRSGEGSVLGNLGLCYSALGETRRAIEYHEQALVISREIGDRTNEGSSLSGLGSLFVDLGQIALATAYFEQALTIARETGYRYGEGFRLSELARIKIDNGRYAEAIPLALECVQIANEISRPNLGSNGNNTLALAYLYDGNLTAAREAAETARRHDVPQNNHNVLALLGVIEVRLAHDAAAESLEPPKRQSDFAPAEAFAAAVQHAEHMLAQSAQNYDALYAKALALSGLALCEGPQHVAAAIAAYRSARAINQDAGIVKRTLRLFDELAKADKHGVLKEVRLEVTPSSVQSS